MIAKRIKKVVRKTTRKVFPKRTPQPGIRKWTGMLKRNGFRLILTRKGIAGRQRGQIWYHYKSGVEVFVNPKNSNEAINTIKSAIKEKKRKMKLSAKQRLRLPGEK